MTAILPCSYELTRLRCGGFPRRGCCPRRACTARRGHRRAGEPRCRDPALARGRGAFLARRDRWGAASGIASAAAFALLYRTLAIGPMSVLSPVTALVSALLPVCVGFLDGERLGGLAVCGMVLALAAVVIVSGGSERRRPFVQAGRRSLLAFGAGAAIALQLVCLDQARVDSGVAPLLMGRAVSSAVVLGAAFAVRGRLGDARPSFSASAAAGSLDSLANFAFLLAVREGDLAVVAVITALYPAGTVLLARALLVEPIGRFPACWHRTSGCRRQPAGGRMIYAGQHRPPCSRTISSLLLRARSRTAAGSYRIPCEGPVLWAPRMRCSNARKTAAHAINLRASDTRHGFSPTDSWGDDFWETCSGNRKPRFAGLSWAGQDSNLRSSDYESAALTS